MHNADSGCSFFATRRIARKPIRRAIGKAIAAKSAAPVTAIITVITIVQTVVIVIGITAWIGGQIPDYTKPETHAINGNDGKVYVRDGVEYVPIQPECRRSGS